VSVNFDIIVEFSVVVNFDESRSGNSFHAITAKVKKIIKILLRPSTGGGSASLKTMTSERHSSYVYQRVERKAPWEPRSFTEDNAFHQSATITRDAAAELAEVLLAGWTSA
jgi:hypothetical protein